MLTNKKGLSDVVTTVLIILLVLAAVAIIASVVLPQVRKSAGQINSDCLTVDIQPVTCTISGTDASIKLKWNNGDASLKGINFIFYKSNGETDAKDAVAAEVTAFGVSATKIFTVGGTLADYKSVAVRTTLNTEDGQGTLCAESQKVDCK